MSRSIESHVRSLPRGITLTVAALCWSCSSGSTSTPPPVTDAGSTAHGDGGNPIVEGMGAACPALTSITSATKIVLSANWPATAATAAGTGTVNIWLLSSYSVSGQAITGTTQTCGNQTPPVVLSALGVQSEGQPAGSTVQVQITIPPAVWSAPGMPKSAATGTIGGWNIGSSFEINPVVALNGLNQTSTWDNPATAWPSLGSGIPTTDLSTGDDGMGHVGITATPVATAPYSLPVTAFTGPNNMGTAPAAKEIYVVLRTELSLYGTSASCTDGSGTATVKLLNNHVVGCVLVDGTQCTADQYGFIDDNTTQYRVSTGTYTTKILSTTGATKACSDVLTALP